MDLNGAFAVVFIFGLPVIAFIIHRVLKHQERIEMIRHGMAPSADFKPTWNVPPQSAPMPGPQHFVYENYAAAQNTLRKGLTTGMIGLALFIGLSFIDLGRPGPWLLGGLIPMFVGIAQVLIALMSGARFNFAPGAPYPNQPPNGAMPGPERQQQAPRDVTPGPYAYRPGNTTELEPPAAPPDRRF
ncbi:MAG: DUF805 domain-containing protein [Candidatus Eremiobacteraeota bacterium]|nr:DUF805 domain-containing protein [Candidatus Eremiobacteraeota bacterium]